MNLQTCLSIINFFPTGGAIDGEETSRRDLTCDPIANLYHIQNT